MTVINMGCIEGMRLFPDAYFDSIVTDPPYELGFMGKAWDASGIANNPAMWAEALRVLKPGGHLLAFSGSRTYHRMVCAIEDAGFEIRDQIMWVYGSGFPKSLDVSKAIDKAAGAERDVIGSRKISASRPAHGAFNDDAYVWKEDVAITAPATDAARQWQGWGTALKPAHEPIVVARKPLAKGCTVAANVLAHGTGAINVDGCRVGDAGGTSKAGMDAGAPTVNAFGDGLNTARFGQSVPGLGRWPANLIHDGSDEVLAAFPQAPGQMADASTSDTQRAGQNVYGQMRHDRGAEPSADSDNEGAVGFKMKPGARRLDAGSAARFFYCAKSSKADRNEGLDEFPLKPGGMLSNTSGQHMTRRDGGAPGPVANNHPTVKPTALMRYLVRLVTPPGGTVLDPFTGSGSTGKACALERFGFIGFELSADYTAIAQARISAARSSNAE